MTRKLRKSFKKLQWLTKEENFLMPISSCCLLLFKNIMLKHLEVAIDHYRAAAEYGSQIAHEKLLIHLY